MSSYKKIRVSLVKIAFKNVIRKKFRSAAIIFAASLACCLIFVITTVLISMESSLDLAMDRLGADLMVVPDSYEPSDDSLLLGSEPIFFYMPATNIELVRAIPGVLMASPQLFVTSQRIVCCTMPTVRLVGYDPETDFTIKPWIKHSQTKLPPGGNYLSVGRNTSFAIEGGKITFFGKIFTISNTLHKTGIRFIDFSAFMTMDIAREMIEESKVKTRAQLSIPDNSISSLLIKLEKGVNAEQVAEDIKQKVPGVRAIITKNVIASVRQHAHSSLYGIMAIGFASWLMTVLFMGMIFFMIMNERQREFGLLRAMGATRHQVLQAVAYESLILSCLGSLLGIGIGIGVLIQFQEWITTSMGEITIIWPSPFVMSEVAFISIIIILLSGTFVSVFPAVRFNQREIYETIRKGR